MDIKTVIKNIVIIAVISALLVLVGYLIGFNRKSVPNETKTALNQVSRDTVTMVVHDTVKIDRPYPVRVTVTDTLLVNVSDTVYVSLPVETKEYRDSTYYCRISGYEPNLDYIETYNNIIYKTETVTVTEKNKPKRFGIGVQAGYGVGKDGLSPYIGIGISYNIFSF